MENKFTNHFTIADFSRSDSGKAVDPEKTDCRVVFVVVACVQLRTFLIHLHAYTDPSQDIIRDQLYWTVCTVNHSGRAVPRASNATNWSLCQVGPRSSKLIRREWDWTLTSTVERGWEHQYITRYLVRLIAKIRGYVPDLRLLFQCPTGVSEIQFFCVTPVRLMIDDSGRVDCLHRRALRWIRKVPPARNQPLPPRILSHCSQGALGDNWDTRIKSCPTFLDAWNPYSGCSKGDSMVIILLSCWKSTSTTTALRRSFWIIRCTIHQNYALRYEWVSLASSKM